ncbi:MAG: MBL fold metallo-hydrolase [Nitrososphaerales archaeon]
MEIIKHIVGILRSNSYLVYDEKSGEGVFIDAGDNASLLLHTVNKKKVKLKAILATHAHFDHILAVEEIKRQKKVKFYLHKDDLPILESMQERGIKYMNLELPEPPKADVLVEDGFEYHIGNYKLKLIHTPGHSPGSVCYLSEDVLFSGDTLFRGAIGRTDTEGGNYEAIIKSIKERLLTLNEKTKVYPGHGSETTIYFEKHFNPFLKEESNK